MMETLRSHLLKISAAFLCFFFFPHLALAEPVRIMPLGASITEGSDSGVIPDEDQYLVGYRKDLKDKLVNQGHQIDYVGSQRYGWAMFSDAENEGHAGWFADGGPSDGSSSILRNVRRFLDENPADIILLHIGTSDLTVGNAPAVVRDEIKHILDTIDEYEQDSDKDVWVVLALIANRAAGCPYSSQTTSLNDLLDSLVTARKDSGDKIIAVDMEDGAGLDYDLVPFGDMHDCKHPYATGYEKMAEEWFRGLLTIMPTANAGPPNRNANPGDNVTLDGTGSTDSLGTIVSYTWIQLEGTPIALNSTNPAKPIFTAPSVSGGTKLTFRLTITDDKNFTHSDECSITVNGPPLAVAGLGQFVNPAASVVLDGTDSSDLNGAIASFQWTQTAGSPVVTLSGANSQTAVFTAPDAGSGGAVLTFRLTVTDDKGATSSDSCMVRINGIPLADAGPDQKVQSGVPVILDGSGSTDDGGDALSYAWAQISGPAVALTDPASINPNFISPFAEISSVLLEFRLTVTDSGGLQATDTCSVEVSPNASGDSNESTSTSSGAGGGGCFITAAGG